MSTDNVGPGRSAVPGRFRARTILDRTRSGLRRWQAFGWELRALTLSWIVFVATTVYFSYQRYLTYQTNTWDLGINMQALWTTAFQGRFLYYTAELSWNSSGSLMGVHMNAILLVLVPFYRVAPGALTLFIIQSVAVAASSLPLYLLVARRTTTRAALAIAWAYLVSAPLLGGVFYDFHAEAFVPLFGLTVWYAWETRRPRLLAISAVALLSVVEFTPLILGAIALMFLLDGLWSWKIKRAELDPDYLRWMVTLPIVVLLVSAVLVPIWFTIPKLVSPSTPPYTQAGVLGGSLSQIFVNLFNPFLVGQALSIHGRAKVVYLGVMVLAGLLFWVLRPRQVLPALPWIGVAMLSSISGYVMPAGNQYTFLSFPFLLPAAASGYSLVSRSISKLPSSRAVPGTPPSPKRSYSMRWAHRRVVLNRRSVSHAVIVGVIVAGFAYSQVQWSPLSPLSTNWEHVYRVPNAHTQVLDRIGQLVPAAASISAEPDLFPQFADRADAYPYVVPDVNYIFFDTTSWWFTTTFPPPTTNPPWDEEVNNLSGPYGVLASDDGVILLESGYTGSPTVFAPVQETIAPSSFSLLSSRLVVDNQSPMGAYIVPNQTANSKLWFGPFAYLTPGAYSVGIWLRTFNFGGGPIELRAEIDLGAHLLVQGLMSPGQLGSGWTLVVWSLTIPHPTGFELTGTSTTSAPGVEFGGIVVEELPLPAPAD